MSTLGTEFLSWVQQKYSPELFDAAVQWVSVNGATFVGDKWAAIDLIQNEFFKDKAHGSYAMKQPIRT